MNPLKKDILKIVTGLLFDEIMRPTNRSISNVAGLEEAVAFVLEERKGLSVPSPTVRAQLTGEHADIFLEVIWDLLCARVITPQNHLNGFNQGGLNQIRLHTDAKTNWKKFKVAADISD